MKLRLPLSLLTSVALACSVETAQAVDYTATVVSSIYTAQNGDITTGFENTQKGDTITFGTNVDGTLTSLSGGYMKNGDQTIAANIIMNGLTIGGGYDYKSYTFNGDISGSGDWTFGSAKSYQNYTFTGNLAGYTGNLSFYNGSANRHHVFTFTNNDTEAKTLNAATVKVGGTVKIDGTGDYIVNSTLTTYNLNADTDVTFSKAITVRTALTVAKDKTVTLGDAASSIAQLNVEGTVKLGLWNFTKISKINIADGGLLSLSTAQSGLHCDNITLDGGGTIHSVGNGRVLGKSGGTITINSDGIKAAVIQGNYNGSLTIASNITGKGILEFQKSDGTNAVNVNGSITDGSGDYAGTLAISQTSGNYYMNHADNTYSGGTTITGGTMTVASNKALGTGEVTVNGGWLKIDGTARTLDNTIQAGNVATIGATGATYRSVTITNTSLSGGSMTGADIAVSGEYALSNITLSDVAFTVAEAADLTFSGVTLADSALTLDTLGTVTYGADISTGVLSGVTLTGTLNLALSSQLVNTYASQEAFSITFTGLDSTGATGITVSQDMEDKFGAVTYRAEGSDTVLSFAGTGSDAVPEPTTATLSLLALAALAARRRRK